MGYSLGGNLTKELDNKNCENDTLKLKLVEVITENEKIKEENRNLTQEKLRLTEKETQQTTDIESLKQQIEGLQTTVNEEKDEKVKTEQDHRKELDEQKTKIEEKKNHEKLELKKEFFEIVEGRNNELATAEHKYNLETQAHKKTKDEREQYKNKAQSLKMK
jgi:hypothetical protein